MTKLLKILNLLLFLGIFVWSCEDDKYSTSADLQLEFSVDTVMFDTIFTNIGSSTKQLKVYNRSSSDVFLNSVKLAEGDNSEFRMNVDGEAGNEVYDIEILAKDSMYIFIEATIQPSGENAPFLVQDSIVIDFNDHIQDVDVMAWGQDFVKLEKETIETTTWTAEKPYVIYDHVTVDSLETLTIEEGTRIYLHKDADFFVKGSVVINGTSDNPVTFQGDRLEELYKNVPDQWGSIVLYPGSSDNVISNAIIKNGNIGLQVGRLNGEGETDVTLYNVAIENMGYAGLIGVNAEIWGENCVIADCGYYGMALLVGGEYEFRHVTVGNYWSWTSSHSRTTPSVIVSNRMTVNQNGESVTLKGDINKAYFGNCIIYGNHADELEFGIQEDKRFECLFDHCLIKAQTSLIKSNESFFKDILLNENPRFIDANELNFQLDTLSPVKDYGLRDIAIKVPNDLLGTNRLGDEGPDLGAYERIEE
ncbi:hypothetical protein EYV94_07345 [Puteibacter caeruleilacunae]|nr:hypothetical protein EYV94_07345 [Puteibacter caeruleilacunae]